MRLLIVFLLLYLLYRIGKSLAGSSKIFKKQERPGGAIDEMVQDPQCKTYVPLRQAKREIIEGKEYFFCSNACADAFKEQKKHEE
jgi:YHS domain-containing protein